MRDPNVLDCLDATGAAVATADGLTLIHNLLLEQQWQGIKILDLAHAQLAHFADLIGVRLTVAGSQFLLSVPAAEAIGIALHELATNAAKYGALSNSRGCVDVTWQIKANEAGQRFIMSWIERDGPQVVPPAHSGFGSTVIKSLTEMTLDGTVALDFAPSGLTWRLECPAANVLGSVLRER